MNFTLEHNWKYVKLYLDMNIHINLELTNILQNDEELVLREAVSVGRLLQHRVQAAAGTILHHQHLVTRVRLTQTSTINSTHF